MYVWLSFDGHGTHFQQTLFRGADGHTRVRTPGHTPSVHLGL